MVTSCPNPSVPQKLPWIRTPLLESSALSKAAGCRIFMKMDMFQPSGSFKSRGVGNLCLKAVESRPGPIRFYSSSGGNAGLAAVTAARMLSQEATVVVPESTTELMKAKIRAAGGHVITYGASWKEADDYIRELIEVDEQGVYCAPFDNPDIWEGNATLVDEIVDDIGGAPDAIIASVGGGGLFCGIQMGLEDHGLLNVPVLAVETEGAASLNASLQAGELVSLPAITSIATSLGARQVASKAFELGKQPNVKSLVLSDAQAAMSCCKLMDDEKIAVEAACGVSAATIYYGFLRKLLPDLKPESKVVLVVCGGSNVSVEMLVGYWKKYGEQDNIRGN
jgi:L-serine/L-threonine ammonia-lyase